MNQVHIHLKKEKKRPHWCRSCLFGEVDMDKETLSQVDDDEVFLAQINLEQFSRFHKNVILPKKGMLSFFIHTTDFSPIVRYRADNSYNKDKDIRVDFNGDNPAPFDFNLSYAIRFSRKKSIYETAFLRETSPFIQLEKNEIILFQYDNKDTHYLSEIPTILFFIIQKEDLIQQNYQKVKTILIHY